MSPEENESKVDANNRLEQSPWAIHRVVGGLFKPSATASASSSSSFVSLNQD
jgi:hypothetical protein